MLNGAPVLLAEDQPYIALDLIFAVEDAGGAVVGPAARVEDALQLLAATTVVGAILDVHLIDGDCSPVLEVLAGRRIPTIIQTGTALPPALAARFPDLIVHNKPCRAAALVAQLEALMGETGQGDNRSEAARP